MQVHEISRKALGELKATGRVYDISTGYGDYLVVSTIAVFGGARSTVFIVDQHDTSYWANHSAEIQEAISLHNAAKDEAGDYCSAYEVWHVIEDNDWAILWGYQNEEKPWTNEDGEHLQAIFPDDKKALRFAYVTVAQRHCDRVVIDGIHGYYCIELGSEGTSLYVQLEEKCRGKHDAYYAVKNASSFYNVSILDTGNVKKNYVCPDCGFEAAVM